MSLRRGGQTALDLLGCLRLDEVARLGAGALWAGALAANPETGRLEQAETMAGLAVVCALLGASLGGFNDLFDADLDRASRLRRSPVSDGRASRRALAMVSVALGALGLVAAAGLGVPVAASALFALWLVYAAPPLRLKKRLLLSNLANLVGGGLVAALGVRAVGGSTADSLWLGVYAGLLVCAGHLNHQAADVDADREAGVRSVAVRWGPAVATNCAPAFVVASTAWLAAAARAGAIPWRAFWPLAAASVVYMVAWVRVMRTPGDTKETTRFRARYRLAYLIAGAASVLLSRL